MTIETRKKVVIFSIRKNPLMTSWNISILSVEIESFMCIKWTYYLYDKSIIEAGAGKANIILSLLKKNEYR